MSTSSSASLSVQSEPESIGPAGSTRRKSRSTDEFYYVADGGQFEEPLALARTESALKDYFVTSLNTVQWRVSNLNVSPGDSLFVFWFALSSYFPLISGCIGPLSNMVSLFAIVCSWKVPNGTEYNEGLPAPKDESWVYGINVVSACLAIFSNFFLLLNFRKKVRYTVSQVLSIGGWLLASMVLMGLIIFYYGWFYRTRKDDVYDFGYGYFFAIITACLHFGNFLLLFLNEVGFVLKKYEPVFNINDVQKSLIFQSLALAVWLIIGSFAAMGLYDCTVGFGLYYCVISIVTIGEQQDVPRNPVAEGIMSVWVTIGLVVFGLIISSVVDTVIDFSSATMYWHRISKLKQYRLKLEKNVPINNKDGYEFMRKVRDHADLTQQLISICMALILFLTIFLFGALGFSYIEGWTYRLGTYFCFCCFVTLGCGNVVPVTIPGHAFFCLWSLASVPSMTILISEMSGLIFSRLKVMTDNDMYDFIYNISKGHSKLEFVTRLLKARDDTVDIGNLEKAMHQTGLGVDADEYKEVIRSRVVSRATSIDGGEGPGVDIEAVLTRASKLESSESVYSTVAIPTHPVDSLFEYIFNNDKLTDLSFLYSAQFVRRMTMTIHLSNYRREDCSVGGYSAKKLAKARSRLMKAIKLIDTNFDVDQFMNSYDLTVGDIPEASDVPLLKPANNHDVHKGVLMLPTYTIQTMFHKKHDYVLNNLSTLQILVAELKKAVLLMCLRPDFKYTFEEWDRFLRLTQNHDYLNENDFGGFWTSKRSPLGYPNNEPQVFALGYLTHIENKLHHFAWEYDDTKYDLAVHH